MWTSDDIGSEEIHAPDLPKPFIPKGSSHSNACITAMQPAH
jgi:hypothetical protein